MCGRARLSSDVSEIKVAFGIPPERPTPNFPPSSNVAPTDSLPVIRYDAKATQRSLDMLRWGLIPSWAKDIKVGFANINAKAEGIENKPAFRKAFERRRCLVPVDNIMNGAKPRPGSSPMRSRSPIAASWRSRVCGKTGALRPASGFGAGRGRGALPYWFSSPLAGECRGMHPSSGSWRSRRSPYLGATISQLAKPGHERLLQREP